MIFKTLTIENFGIYQGQHTIDLSVTDDQPVILFGGLNGGGKTTFLDALQLVLYGKHAKCSNRGYEAYSTFLAGTKNRFAPEDASTLLSLTFSHRTDTQSKEYTVQRSWLAKAEGETREKIQVSTNGVEDKHLSQHWDEFVNEFIPLTLADLFFFDGEKIEDLAHPDRSAELVRTGIENLLGIDLISQLHIDLGQIEKKRQSENVDKGVITKVNECENEIGQQNAITSDLTIEIAELTQLGSDANLSINKARRAVQEAGAHLLEARDDIKFELGETTSKMKHHQSEQVKLAAGVGPLGLVTNLISETKTQIQAETDAKQAQALTAAINEYETKLLASITKTSKQAQTAIKATMTTLAEERQTQSQTPIYINTDIGIFSGLDERVTTEQALTTQLKQEADTLKEQQALLEKRLETIPNYETAEPLLTALAEAEAAHKGFVTRIAHKQQQLAQTQAKSDVLATRYTHLLSQQSKDTFEQKRAVQVAEHIDTLKQTLQSFGQQLVADNIARLEELIKAKFQSLGRKEQLISQLTISPETFEVTLYDTNGESLTPAKLSAGERQLLAIAILWGLAEASGREIPTVIDTPLGRLDGQHRTKLVNNYFPNASQQVILLSTDEEINGQYYEQLKPTICREYNITYNEQDKSSTFAEGYF